MSILTTATLLLQAKNYSGSGNWLDESGNGHHATPIGTPAWDGTKFTLNGTTDLFEISPAADLQFVDASWTIMAWGEQTNPAINGVLYSSWPNSGTGPGSGGQEIDMSDSSNFIRSRVADTAGQIINSATVPIESNTRYFVTGRYSDAGGTLDVLLGGVVQRSISAVMGDQTSSKTAFRIGARYRSDSGRGDNSLFAGNIYAVAIWRSALSDADIAAAINELQTGPFSPAVQGATY